MSQCDSPNGEESPECLRCLDDKRLLSKDKKHRLCIRLMGEVTVEECRKLRDGTLGLDA